MARDAVSKQARVVMTLLARAEESGDVELQAAAVEFDVKLNALTKWVEDFVYLERRLLTGELFSPLVTFMIVDGLLIRHGNNRSIRDLVTKAPPIEVAVGLLIAATQYITMYDDPDENGLHYPLISAINILRKIVGQAYPATAKAPALIADVEESIGTLGRSRAQIIRYMKDDFSVSDRTVEIRQTYSIGGYWYAKLLDCGDGKEKSFRIDRILEISDGGYFFPTPPTGEIPDSFDLSELANRVTIRTDDEALDALPNGVEIDKQTTLGDGRVEVELIVYGESRLDHLLLAIGPSAEVVGPPEMIKRRAAHAASLLSTYLT